MTKGLLDFLKKIKDEKCWRRFKKKKNFTVKNAWPEQYCSQTRSD